MNLRSLAHLAATLLLCIPVVAAQAQDDPLSGLWKGDIMTPNGPLPAVGWFEPDGEGGWTGSADTPTQSCYGIPWSEVSFDGTDLLAKIALTGATYEATLKGDTLTGIWKQRGGEMPLRLKRQTMPAPVPEELASQLVGTWEGNLDLGAVSLRVVVALQRSAAGSLHGHMISPDQSPDEIPAGRVDYKEGRTVLIRVGAIGTTFEVTVAEDGSRFEGKFTQGAATLEIAMKKVSAPTAVLRPQEPKPPFPYRAEEVTYRNDAAEITLAGTLTLPAGEGPFPAALLITGSGPQNRDEEIFQHKPFWVIADHLTRRGFAVLRVDDRGVGGSTAGPDPGKATSFDFADDVEAGVAFLAARDDIAADRIGLIGHSEGGVIAPIVAARNDAIAFIVLLAGTGIRGAELLALQSEAIHRADGMEEGELSAALKTHSELMAIFLDESLDSDTIETKARAAIEANPDFLAATDEEQETGMAAALAQLNNPWMIAFVRHDPAPTLEQVRCPVLAVNGEVDLQVPCHENLQAIEAALKRGGNQRVTTWAFPGLNHLFQHSETGLISEYGKIEETFAPEVLDFVSAWLKEQT